MSFKTRFAEVPGKQFARVPWPLGVWAERIAGFGIREGCLAVMVPGTNFTAHRVLFLISFPVVETLHFISSLSDCAEGVRVLRPADFAFEAYLQDQESGETRCYHLFPSLETSSIPLSHSQTPWESVSPGALWYTAGFDCAFHL